MLPRNSCKFLDTTKYQNLIHPGKPYKFQETILSRPDWNVQHKQILSSPRTLWSSEVYPFSHFHACMHDKKMKTDPTPSKYSRLAFLLARLFFPINFPIKGKVNWERCMYEKEEGCNSATNSNLQTGLSKPSLFKPAVKWGCNFFVILKILQDGNFFHLTKN